MRFTSSGAWYGGYGMPASYRRNPSEPREEQLTRKHKTDGETENDSKTPESSKRLKGILEGQDGT